MLHEETHAERPPTALPNVAELVASESEQLMLPELLSLQAPLPSVSLGIRVKLVALMVTTSFLIVGVLASYFPARQISELRSDLRERASMYGRLASLQLRSAVAFNDQQTAREVLGAVAKDPLVKGAAIYADNGVRLGSEGTLSSLAQSARRGFDAPRTFSLPGRVLITVPVTSLEGPRGTLVMELSTTPANAAQRQLIRVALSVGTGALLLGTLLAWGIARSLASRVERIAKAASAVAQGDFGQTLALTGPRDEIGVLAHAFDAMVRHLRELIGHINHTAQQENTRLELLVGERTTELDRKNADLHLVLDNVEQGFITIDRNGLVVGEQSRIIETWLSTISTGASLWGHLDRISPKREARFEIAWSQLVEDVMPASLCLAQMPQVSTIDSRHLRFEYKPLGDEDSFDKMLVVISDSTALVERARVEQQELDLLSLSSRLINDRVGFLEFANETEILLGRIARGTPTTTQFKRDLHTLKGNAALFGLSSLSALCHAAESDQEEHGAQAAVDCSPIVTQWAHLRAKTQQLLGERQPTGIEVDEAEYQSVLDALRNGADAALLEQMLGAWRLEPVRLRLERAGAQLTTTAARLGKGSPPVIVDTAPIYLASNELSEFWSVFAHIVRNAAVHGLEQPEERAQRGDAGQSSFSLRAGIADARLFVELADTGPGIDWNVIRARALRDGLRAETQADLVEALFADGISAREDVTAMSGRGVGLSAVREVCSRQHGKVDVVSAKGRGTTFRFSWPTSEFGSLILFDVGALS